MLFPKDRSTPETPSSGTKILPEWVVDPQKRKRDAYMAQLQKRTQVQRARILQHAHGSPMTMDREIQGLYAAQNSNFGIIWATGLRRKQRLDFQSTIITALAKDEVTGAIVVGNSRSGMSDYDLGEPVGVCSWAPNKKRSDGKEGETDQYELGGKRLISPQNGVCDVTSVKISPSRTLISSTLADGGQCAVVSMTKLVSPEEYDYTHPTIDKGVTINFRMPDSKTTLYDSSPNPSPSKPTVAIAASGSIHVLTESFTNYYDCDGDIKTSTSDVLALTWMTPTLLAAGRRDGIVELHDIRSAGSVNRLRHPSAIAHMKAVDEFRVVVAGLENKVRAFSTFSFTPLHSPPSIESSPHIHPYIHPSRQSINHLSPTNERNPITTKKLSMYDLRHAPKLSSTGTRSSKAKNKQPPSKPYITYPTYRNKAHLNLGFDISISTTSPQGLGLVAAASDEQTIALFDMWTGKEVVEAGWGRNKKWDHPIRCLEFVGGRWRDGLREGESEEEGEREREQEWEERERGLLVGCGGIVEEWGW
ncbi:hypothetical protein MMC09_005702 [Bachmanniomyces sp. S44760]|nr:hypothetical protein [Bachmanniomyces sp. S44760]